MRTRLGFGFAALMLVSTACGAQSDKPVHYPALKKPLEIARADDKRGESTSEAADAPRENKAVEVASADPNQQAVEVVQVEGPRPKLEVVFVLDTTGSMSDLIEGAKQKIWTIADELASAKPTPDLRVGLIAYRDRGDQYVTQRFALSSDLDTIYQQLHSLSADGGGDMPESVNQALYEAVHDTDWSKEQGVYRTVFLVGDAPPHMDYQDDVPYRVTTKEAKERGIVINTVQCGDLEGTHDVWLAISKRTQGTYAAIAQDGGMQQIAAPMDDEINRLNAAISATVVPYGSSEMREKTLTKARMASEAPAAASASRRSYLSKKGGVVVTGGGDLVDDMNSGKVNVGAMAEAELPADLRELSPEQRQQKLEEKKAERKKLQDRLDQLVQERAAYVREETEKRKNEGARDGFDMEVMKAVKEQAAARTSAKY